MSLKLRLSNRNETDFRAFLRMGKLFLEASPYKGMSFDEEKLKQIFDFPTGDVLILFLVNEEDNPIGLLLATIQETYFSRDKTACELAWWVDEEHRGSKASLDLIYAYEDWAYRMGAKKVTLSALEGLTNPRIQKLYEGMGFTLAEQAYIKEF